MYRFLEVPSDVRGNSATLKNTSSTKPGAKKVMHAIRASVSGVLSVHFNERNPEPKPIERAAATKTEKTTAEYSHPEKFGQVVAAPRTRTNKIQIHSLFLAWFKIDLFLFRVTGYRTSFRMVISMEIPSYFFRLFGNTCGTGEGRVAASANPRRPASSLRSPGRGAASVMGWPSMGWVN